MCTVELIANGEEFFPNARDKIGYFHATHGILNFVCTQVVDQSRNSLKVQD